MALTKVSGTQITDASIQRKHLDIVTPGQSVPTRIVAGGGITLSSTGVDTGTGVVTISVSSVVSNANNQWTTWKDSTGFVDINTFKVDASNNLYINAKSAGVINFQFDEATQLAFNAGNITYSKTAFVIGSDTVDGTDNKYFQLCSGSTASASRGAFVTAYGNEVASTGGQLILGSGSGFIALRLGSSSQSVQIQRTDWNPTWSFNHNGTISQNSTYGGDIIFSRTGSTVRYPLTDTIAAAGSSQGTGTALTNIKNIVTSIASGTAVVLPTIAPGSGVTVFNATGSGTVNVYPPTGVSIDSLAANAAYGLEIGQSVTFFAVTSTVYRTEGKNSILSMNGLTGAYQTFINGSSGNDFSISSTGTSHTFNIPSASTTARGLVTTGTQTLGGNKTLISADANTAVLLLKGASSQSSPLLDLQTSTSVTQAKILNDGSFYFSGDIRYGLTGTDPATNYLTIRYAGTNNIDTRLLLNHDSNRWLLVRNGALDLPLYIHGTQGTSTGMPLVLGPTTQAVAGRLTVATNDAATKGVVIVGAASQSANFFEILNSSSVSQFSVASTGNVTAAGSVTAASFSTTGSASVGSLSSTGAVSGGSFSTSGAFSAASSTLTGNITAASHIFSAAASTFSASTSAASDTASLVISGGGGGVETRGSTVSFYGNQHATLPGILKLNAGTATNADIQLYTGTTSVKRYSIDSSGNFVMDPTYGGSFILGKTDSIFRTDTVDATDNKRIQVFGGGGSGNGRGASVNVHGNEYTGANGLLSLIAGDASAAKILLNASATNGTIDVQIGSTSKVSITGTELAAAASGYNLGTSSTPFADLFVGTSSTGLVTWGSWTPSYTQGAGSSMTYGTVTTTAAKYIKVGKICIALIQAVGTTGGTAYAEIRFSLPFTAASIYSNACLGGASCGEGAGLIGGTVFFNTTTQAAVKKYDGSAWGLGANRSISALIVYETAS